EQQLVQARSGHVDQAQFGLRGAGRRPTALRDVLPAAARRLNHLISRTGARIDETVAERDCRIVDDRGRLKRPQLPIAAAQAQPIVLLRHLTTPPGRRVPQQDPVLFLAILLLRESTASRTAALAE